MQRESWVVIHFRQFLWLRKMKCTVNNKILLDHTYNSMFRWYHETMIDNGTTNNQNTMTTKSDRVWIYIHQRIIEYKTPSMKIQFRIYRSDNNYRQRWGWFTSNWNIDLMEWRYEIGIMWSLSIKTCKMIQLYWKTLKTSSKKQ